MFSLFLSFFAGIVEVRADMVASRNTGLMPTSSTMGAVKVLVMSPVDIATLYRLFASPLFLVVVCFAIRVAPSILMDP